MKTAPFALCLLTLGAASATYAGTCISPAPGKEEKEVQTAPETPLGSLTLGSYFSQHGTGGYLDSLGSLWSTKDHDMALFLDSRYHLEDSSQFIDSDGLAFRKMLPGSKAILGANAYYDSIDSEHDHHFNQLGLGAEVLTHYVDWHFNYYLPETGNKSFDTIDTPSGRFQRLEAGLEGLNTEIGFLIPGLDKYVETRVFGGYYHYNNPFGHDLQGFKGRVEAHVLPGVIAEVEYWQSAVLMEGHWTAGVRIQVPFSLWNLAKGRNPFEGAGEAFRPGVRNLDDRMSDMVMRSPRIETISTGLHRVSTNSSSSKVLGPSQPPAPPAPFPIE